ncbi:V-set and immunoglobulin domain-containing protein 10 [Clarias gariepinus]
MKQAGVTLLHFLLLYQTVFTVANNTFLGDLGEKLVLQCPDLPVNATPRLVTRWIKDGVVLATHNHSQPVPVMNHISILDDSSLNINGLMMLDDAEYECKTIPESTATPSKIRLLVAGGPKVKVNPATRLANGTWFVVKGSRVTFNCSSNSHPSQNLNWTVEDVSTKDNITRASGSKSYLDFEIINITPIDQTNYTCSAENTVSKKVEARRLELLVYYAPAYHPDCFWHHGPQLDQVLFNCSWYGAYPTPTLTVSLDGQEDGKPVLSKSQVTDNFELSLNRSMLFEGQKIICVGQHVTQNPGDNKFCTFTLAAPYPLGAPMVAAMEGSNITLTCSESKSLPPAKTTWKRGIEQVPIVPSSKYIVVEEGPQLSLTIVNATKEDQGVYFCWSENALAYKALEVYLTIRPSGSISGVVFGIFISILILAAGITVGYLMYTRRDRICLSFTFGRSTNDNGDVLNLIESDEEDILHDAVPRLPPLTNGHGPAPATTLVEIHRIQSSDHEDNVNDTDQDHHTQDLNHLHTPDHTPDYTPGHTQAHPLDHFEPDETPRRGLAGLL